MKAIYFILSLFLMTLIACSTATQAVRQDARQDLVHKAKPVFEFRDFSEGLAAVSKDGETGYMDSSGKFQIKILFHDARAFSEGLAAVQLNEKWGYIDHKGKYVVNPRYSGAGYFSEGLAPVREGNRWGYIDKKGKAVINSIFDEAGGFSQGLAPVKIDGKWGFIAKNGKFQIQPAYKEAKAFRDGLAPVNTAAAKAPWGFINEHGKMAIQPQFDGAGVFSEGQAPVLIDGKWGYINKSGKFIINPQYDKALPFSDKLAAVRTGQKWGYINTAGRAIAKPQYAAAASFSGGYAAASINGREWEYINGKGEKAGMAAGRYLGDYVPDVRLNLAHNPQVPYSFYNMTSNYIFIEANPPVGYFGGLSGTKIPPFTTLRLAVYPSGLGDYSGYIDLLIKDEKGNVAGSFALRAFTVPYDAPNWGKYAAVTLLDVNLDAGDWSNFSSDPACHGVYEQCCSNPGVIYDRGVRLVGSKYKVFLTTAIDECKYRQNNKWRPPVSIMVMPAEIPMPQPYSY